MSEREQIAKEIFDTISNNPRFNAPYGVLEGMTPYGKGKIRTITFGVARYLDATVDIISPKNIQIKGRGPLITQYGGRYSSAKEVIDKLK